MGGVFLLGDHHQVSADGSALAGTTSPVLQIVFVELDMILGHDLGDRGFVATPASRALISRSALPGALLTFLTLPLALLLALFLARLLTLFLTLVLVLLLAASAARPIGGVRSFCSASGTIGSRALVAAATPAASSGLAVGGRTGRPALLARLALLFLVALLLSWLAGCWSGVADLRLGWGCPAL